MLYYVFVLKCLKQKDNITVKHLRGISDEELSVRPKIDEVDVKILKILLEDPRTSFAKIAKDCEMSTNAIRMRFKRLKETGVITGAIMQVNPKSLGFECIAHLGIQADFNEEENVLEFLENIPGIIMTNRQIGKYNLVSFLALKNVDELAHLVELVNNNPYVMNVDTCIWVDAVWMDHPEKLIIKLSEGLSHTTDFVPYEKKPKLMIASPHDASELAEKEHSTPSLELDKIDLSIISILSENARISFRKVAKQLGISTQSVIKRYKRMREIVLPFSSITLDLGKIGYIGQAIFWIKISHERRTAKVFREICQIPNIIIAYKCLGHIDIVVAAPFSSINQLIKLNQEISKTSGITQIDLLLHQPFPMWPLNLFSKLLPTLLKNT